MKCLSLWEPWATFIAKGWKTIETRSWPTLYRGPIAIHAAKTRQCIEFDEDVDDILHVARLPLNSLSGHVWPLGRIVATAVLVDCRPTTPKLVNEVSQADIAMGNFSEGRFGWCLKDVKPLPSPIPFVGMQGLFTLPAAALEVIAGRAPVPTTPLRVEKAELDRAYSRKPKSGSLFDGGAKS